MPKTQVTEVPVYLFTGFLEAGKTRFIQGTLEDERFNNGERTLLLVCEEGVEEYDPTLFASDEVFVHVIEEESDLTPAYLADLLYKSGAGRVVIEYNGMWMLQSLFEALPPEWTLYQEFLFADAATFLNYNANMRSLVVDKLNTCEMVVFNRFTDAMDKMEYHKVVRGISRRADIVYEYSEERVEFDDIEDPLPFDLDAPVIDIDDRDYALFYRDISEEPEKYDGKTVHFKGIVAVGGKVPNNCFVVGRHVMRCCVDDITYSGLICRWDEGARTLHRRDWVDLQAKISYRYHKAYGQKGPVLTALSVAPATAPQQEVATFY